MRPPDTGLASRDHPRPAQPDRVRNFQQVTGAAGQLHVPGTKYPLMQSLDVQAVLDGDRIKTLSVAAPRGMFRRPPPG